MGGGTAYNEKGRYAIMKSQQELETIIKSHPVFSQLTPKDQKDVLLLLDHKNFTKENFPDVFRKPKK